MKIPMRFEGDGHVSFSILTKLESVEEIHVLCNMSAFQNDNWPLDNNLIGAGVKNDIKVGKEIQELWLLSHPDGLSDSWGRPTGISLYFRVEYQSDFDPLEILRSCYGVESDDKALLKLGNALKDALKNGLSLAFIKVLERLHGGMFKGVEHPGVDEIPTYVKLLEDRPIPHKASESVRPEIREQCDTIDASHTDFQSELQTVERDALREKEGEDFRNRLEKQERTKETVPDKKKVAKVRRRRRKILGKRTGKPDNISEDVVVLKKTMVSVLKTTKTCMRLLYVMVVSGVITTVVVVIVGVSYLGG